MLTKQEARGTETKNPPPAFIFAPGKLESCCGPEPGPWKHASNCSASAEQRQLK